MIRRLLRRRGAAVPALVVLTGLGSLGACGPKQSAIAQLSPEDLWVQGIEHFNAEEWDEAIRYFERFALAAGADPRVYQARYYVGQANFEQERYVTAAAEFARVASDLGRAELADDARFMACRSYEELAPGPQLDQEYTRAAIEHCRTLIEYFPDTEYRDEATAVIGRMRNRLAEKVYEVGDWYFNRRAYDSAIIYYEDVADEYPGTVWAPRALERLVGIYEILEYEEERQQTLDRLLGEYPQSPEARERAGAGAAGVS